MPPGLGPIKALQNRPLLLRLIAGVGGEASHGQRGVEILANGSDLTKLKFGEPETAPAFGSADQRAEHELEDRLFAEALIRNQHAVIRVRCPIMGQRGTSCESGVSTRAHTG